MDSVTRGNFLVVGVVLGVLLGLLIIIPTPAFSISVPDIEILYVAANQTSREIFCKLRGNGTVTSTVYEVRVNGTIVTTGDPLPITLKNAEYKTYVFRYDGPWEGSILIFFDVHSFFRREKGGPEILVDLQTISKNPIEGAYPSKIELFYAWLLYRESQYGPTRGELIFWWFMYPILALISLVLIFKIWRSEHFS